MVSSATKKQASIEALIENDPEVARIAAELSDASADIRSNFLKDMEDTPIPPRIRQLIDDANRESLVGLGEFGLMSRASTYFNRLRPALVPMLLVILTILAAVIIFELRSIRGELPGNAVADNGGRGGLSATSGRLPLRSSSAIADATTFEDEVEQLAAPYDRAEVAELRSALSKALDPMEAIARDHKVLARIDGLHLSEPLAADYGEFETTLAELFEKPVYLPEFSEAGYQYKGARMAALNGAPAGNAFYQSTRNENEIISLWIAKANSDRLPEGAFSVGNLNLISWTSKLLSYVIVSSQPPSELQEFKQTLIE